MTVELSKYVPRNDIWPREKIKPRKKLREIRRDAALAEMKASIEQYGLLNSLLVMDNGELFGGYHRLACLDDLGVKDIPVRVYPVMPEELVTCVAAIDNLSRSDLTPQEQSRLCFDLEQAGMTRALIAHNIKKSAGWVTQAMAVYECPPDIQEAFWAGKYSHGQCYKIAGESRERPEPPGKDAVRIASLKFPLERHTVAIKGDDFSLLEAVDLLDAAIKAMKAAIKKNYSIKTFAKAQADMAAKGG